MAKRLSVINFKGGVGKTTLALHLGCYLAGRRSAPARVLMVDVDHQSSLSSVTMKQPDSWDAAAAAGTTINRVFSAFTGFATGGAHLPGREIIHSQPFGTWYPTLDIVPSQLELDDTEIELAATTIGTALVSEWNKRTLLCRWLEHSGVEDDYDFILFDCPPATKIVSQNAIAASHAYVIPVIPEALSTRGVTHFRQLVANGIDTRLKAYAANIRPSDVPKTYVPDTQLGGIVVSIAQTHGPADSGYTNEHTQQMGNLRRRWGAEVMTHVIDRATGVAESLGNGWPVYLQGQHANVVNRGLPGMFDQVFNELLMQMGW